MLKNWGVNEKMSYGEIPMLSLPGDAAVGLRVRVEHIRGRRDRSSRTPGVTFVRARLLVVARVDHHAVVVLRQAGHEVLRLARRAAHAEVALVRGLATAEQLVLIVAIALIARRPAIGPADILRPPRIGGRLGREGAHVEGVRVVNVPSFSERSHLALPAVPFLVVMTTTPEPRAGAVDRRRRGALQHLNRLDVVRVDVGDAIRAVVLRVW